MGSGGKHIIVKEHPDTRITVGHIELEHLRSDRRPPRRFQRCCKQKNGFHVAFPRHQMWCREDDWCGRCVPLDSCLREDGDVVLAVEVGMSVDFFQVRGDGTAIDNIYEHR